MFEIDIVPWAQSIIGFMVDRDWQDGGWVLGNRPIRLAPHHKAILHHIFERDSKGKLYYDVICWCEPAKSGKSAICGLVAQYVSLHGEMNSQIIMASNSQRQAMSLMFKSLTSSIKTNPVLRGVNTKTYDIEFPNGNIVSAIPSNSKTQAGSRYSLALFDEVWGYTQQDAKRLWSEFKTDPTRLMSLRFATGYAGYVGESDLWQRLLDVGLQGEPTPGLEHIVNADGAPACWSNGRHFTFWSHVCRQPWQSEEWIQTQRKSLRDSEFRRMIKTEFVEGSGDFFSYEDWQALIDLELKPLPPGSDKPISVGLDIATKPKGDDCACIAVYPDKSRLWLAWHKVWKGGRRRRHDLKLSESVEPYLLKKKEQYRIKGLYFDPYQALQLAENLRRAGMRCIEVPQTHSSRGPKDTRLFELASNQQIVLYDHPEIRGMASAASAKELGNGMLFITKRGRGMIDLLIALSNCADEALRPQGIFLAKASVSDEEIKEQKVKWKKVRSGATQSAWGQRWRMGHGISN